MDGRADRPSSRGDRQRDVGAEGVGEAHVHDDALAEERAGPRLGAVEELIGNYDVERLELFAQAADGAGRHDLLDAEQHHAPDVGAVVDLGGQDAVTTRVARQEGGRHAAQVAHEERVAGRSERSLEFDFASVVEQLVETGTADDADLGLLSDCAHEKPPAVPWDSGEYTRPRIVGQRVRPGPANDHRLTPPDPRPERRQRLPAMVAFQASALVTACPMIPARHPSTEE